MLNWGGRILGWSLRKDRAAWPSAGYTAGAWTAAAVQRICRRHNNPDEGAGPKPPRLVPVVSVSAQPNSIRCSAIDCFQNE